MSHSQTIAELTERTDLLLRSHTSHDVARETAEDEALVGREAQRANHISHDGCKGVSIVKAEGSHAMTAPAKIRSFIQAHALPVPTLPECLRRGMAIRRWLMQRILGHAQHRVLSRDKRPRVVCEPRSLHNSFGLLFLRCFDPLQLFNACALQETLACLCINRFSRETILDSQCIRQHSLKDGVIQQLGIDGRAHGSFITSRITSGNPHLHA